MDQEFIEQIKVERRLLVELYKAALEDDLNLYTMLIEVERVIEKHQLEKKYSGRGWT